MHPITCDKFTISVVVSLNREYGTIDDVDIDLHINIGFLDVSLHSSFSAHTTSSVFAHYYSNFDILPSNTSLIIHCMLIIYLCNEKWP